ncbi:dephospho-CoA kinase [uncultured Jatrophihabitans sp.]|uniref:dephospho-CoA kinase n=1 Tax=uncultured Jatrophihabitans sp. TaxID=1610747 RepID=UPI0035CB3D9F
MRIGLTGGVGSGKSTVAALLAERGAVIIDADAIAREVVAKGTPGLAAVIEAFGTQVLTATGELDRPAMASIVFTDEDKLAALNAIVHPLVGARVAELLAGTGADDIVVNDVPLLVETNPQAEGFDLVIVVEASLSTRLERLASRGMAEQDARGRMARQASDEQRRAAADVVIDNDGSLDDLRAEVDRAWARVEAPGLKRAKPIE